MKESRRVVCPSCGGELQTVERQGIAIERCASCRGIWLDRGELEKLVALGGDHGGRAVYERPVGEEGEDPDPAEKLATRRSFFAELFDHE